MRKLCIPLLAIFLSGCAAGGVYGPLDQVKAAVDSERRAALARAENLRCRWPVHWIGDMVKERGPVWLQGYVASCPELRALILLVIGQVVDKAAETRIAAGSAAKP